LHIVAAVHITCKKSRLRNK